MLNLSVQPDTSSCSRNIIFFNFSMINLVLYPQSKLSFYSSPVTGNHKTRLQTPHLLVLHPLSQNEAVVSSLLQRQKAELQVQSYTESDF